MNDYQGTPNKQTPAFTDTDFEESYTPRIDHYYQQLNHLIDLGESLIKPRLIGSVDYASMNYPIHALEIGHAEPGMPCLVFTGGVHGLEVIGTQVVLAYLETLIKRLRWDTSLVEGLKKLRLIFVPLVNPVGLMKNTRANGNGVDLMRNAPLDAECRVPFLVGGHRLSKALPWYRGNKMNQAEGMETEAQTLCQFIENNLFDAPFSMVLDCHSGFGFHDRIWFPYAYKKEPFHHLPEAFALYQLLKDTYPHLDYVFEPQSMQYNTHGDLWDYLYIRARQKDHNFIPLTMEMGSWRWVKKNPRQAINMLGLFNPLVSHRLQRTLRRHTVLMEFLLRACRAYGNWLPQNTDRNLLREQAIKKWYNAK